jgi:hypothetical protein
MFCGEAANTNFIAFGFRVGKKAGNTHISQTAGNTGK